MRKADVKIGGLYKAKISNKVVTVKILEVCPYGGWWARNTDTNYRCRIKSAGKLREEVLV